MSIVANIQGIVARLLPLPVPDTNQSQVRLARYAEAMTVPIYRTKHPLAIEGSYFSTQNPTLGTALAAAVQASFSDTVAAFVFYNGSGATPNAVNLELDAIKMMFTVAPASATGMRYAVKLDGGNRAPTAGQTILAGPGGSPGASAVGPVVRNSLATVWGFTGGAFMTVPASTPTARVVAAGGIGALPVVGSEFMIRFGSSGPNSGAVAAGCSHAAPVTVPPGWYCVVHLWFPSNASTGASMELDIGWSER